MTLAMFSGAQNIRINGSQFSIIQATCSDRAVDLLRSHCALGTLLDSIERFDPPRCSPKTRKALIEEILKWIRGGDEAALMAWLYGGAGAGKSALAQTIAETRKREGLLAGCFFFSRTSTPDRSDGNRLIPTLVFQLLSTIPAIRPYVEESINGYLDLFNRSRRTQMDHLFVEPLLLLSRPTHPIPTHPQPEPTSLSTSAKATSRRHILSATFWKSRLREETARKPSAIKINGRSGEFNSSNSTVQKSPSEFNGEGTTNNLNSKWSGPRLIVIDGLDECENPDIQTDLLRILANAIPRLPFPLRFLVTSRPEGHIVRTFKYDECFQDLGVRQIDLGDDKEANDDIRLFLTLGFQEIHRVHPFRAYLAPSWPSRDAITTLVQKSSCHFIYASTAMKYIGYAKDMPDARLGVVLGLSVPPTTDKPFAQLDTLYTHIFMSVEEPRRANIRCIFGIMAIYTGSLFIRGISPSPASLEEYLQLRVGEIDLLLEPLLSLVVLPHNRQQDIKILHASLIDFLLDPSRSGDLCLDLGQAHEMLARHFLRMLATYTLDGTLAKKNNACLTICSLFLRHCENSFLSDHLLNYLCSFPFLYNIMLQPGLLSAPFWHDHERLFYIPNIIGRFLTLLSDKDIEDGESLHSLHAEKVEQKLRSIGGDLDPRLFAHSASEPVFEDRVYQSRHQVHKAFINILPSISDTFSNPSGIMSPIDGHYPAANDDIRSHFLVILLPSFGRKDLQLCASFARLAEFSPDSNKELHQVLRKRLVEYFQRIHEVVDSEQLNECKDRWCLDLGQPALELKL